MIELFLSIIYWLRKIPNENSWQFVDSDILIGGILDYYLYLMTLFDKNRDVT